MIDKGKIRPIVEGQTGQEVANNLKANFNDLADGINANETALGKKLEDKNIATVNGQKLTNGGNISAGIGEAPTDGKLYGRNGKTKNWQEVTGGGGGGSVEIDTVLDSSSTNNKAAGAKAVVDKLVTLVHKKNEKEIQIKDNSDAFYFTDPQGYVLAKISKEGISAVKFIDKRGKNIGFSSPLAGKHIWSIGDSLRLGYMPKLVELTGAIYDDERNRIYVNGADDKYIGFNQLINQAYALIDEVRNNHAKVDYIFVEDVHWIFDRDVNTVEPFLCKAIYLYEDKIFNSHQEAKMFFREHTQEVVTKFTPQSNAIIGLKVRTLRQAPKLRLKTGATTKAGQVYIKFTSSNGDLYQAGIPVEEGLSLLAAVNKINEIQFSESGSPWENDKHHQHLGTPSIPFIYNGDQGLEDAQKLVDFDFGTTGLELDGITEISESVSYRYDGFYSRDTSKWIVPTTDESESSVWRYIDDYSDAYKWMKALVELLMQELPFAKIVFFSMANDMWKFDDDTLTEGGVLYDLKNKDGSFNLSALYATPRHKKSEACAEGMKRTAEYYNFQFVDVMHIWGITPLNWKSYYKSMDVHPLSAGYERVAEVLAEKTL